jgi:hypothetical protein
LGAVLDGATFVDDTQKKLVESMRAAGAGFDEIAQALEGYKQAQGVLQSVTDQIQRLTDPLGYELTALRRAQEERDKQVRAAADAGYLSAQQFDEITAQLTNLKALEIDDVFKRAAGGIDQVREAHEREAAALQETIDKFKGFAQSLADYRRTLTAGPTISAAGNLQAVQANFRDIAARTKLGDVAAFEQFQDAAEAFRQTALENAPNARAYARTLAEIRNATQDAEDVATRHASIAEEQLDALKKLVEPLLQINKSVLSVRDAIMKLQGAMAGPGGIQGQVVALAAQGPTAGANDNFNAAAYLAANKDIGKAAAAAGVDAATFALQHYTKTGQFEIAAGYRSRGFATGGGFTVGGSSSTGDRVPVNFMANRGEHVNISREDNMAKVAAALERQNQLLAEQNATLAKIAKSTGNTDKILTFTTHGGEALRTVAA